MLREDSGEVLNLKASDIRNRALLLVLFELGLTSAEVRALSHESFVDGGRGKGASIRITSGGVNQLRTMVVSDEVRSAVASWLQVRATAGKHAMTPALFSSQTGKPMTDENLLVLVRAHLLAASRAAGQGDPVRAGPQIVRNTRLVQWMLSGMPQPEVALRAGLKNVRGLLHLRQHLPDGPRLELARASSRKDDEPLRPAYRSCSQGDPGGAQRLVFILSTGNTPDPGIQSSWKRWRRLDYPFVSGPSQFRLRITTVFRRPRPGHGIDREA